MSGKLTSHGITIRHGDSFNILMQFKTPQQNFDLTNSEIRMSVRDTEKPQNPIISKTAEIIDSVNGKARLVITAQDTNINIGEYETDIQITLPNGDVHTIYPQNLSKPAYFIITPDVTN